MPTPGLDPVSPCDLTTWDDPQWCDEFLSLFPPQGYRPVDAPDAWHVRCLQCRSAQTELSMLEAYALEGLRNCLTPCCAAPDIRAFPSMFEPVPLARCERCGLTIEHVHTCAWSPE